MLIANRHIGILANSLYTFAAVLGLPSLLGSLYFSWIVLQLHQAAPAKDSAPAPEAANSALSLLDLGVKVVSTAFGFIGQVGEAISKGLAIGSLAVLTFSVCLFFLGRGLHAHSGWARGLTGVLMTIVLLVGLALSSGGLLRSPVALFFVLAGGYGVWALWRGFV